MVFTEGGIKTTLKQHRYKLTRQRRLIISEFASSEDFVTPADLYNKLQKNHPDIGMVTVYRTLDMLDKLGLAYKVHAGGDCHSYKINTVERHHHLLCSNCGAVINFTCSEKELTVLEGKITAETGFAIKNHILEFVGYCQKCNKDNT
jgi:Fur family ferric uptake transcriptional regulator